MTDFTKEIDFKGFRASNIGIPENSGDALIIGGEYVTDCHNAPFGLSSTYDSGFSNAPNEESGWYLFRTPNFDCTKSTLQAISRTTNPTIFQKNEYSSGNWSEWVKVITSNNTDIAHLSGIETFTDGKAFSKGAIFYGEIPFANLPSGFPYIAQYYSSQYTILRLLGYSGSSYQPVAIGSMISPGIFQILLNSDGSTQFNGNVLLKKISALSIFSNGNAETAPVIDLNNGNEQSIILNSPSCALTFSNPASKFSIEIIQDATGGRDLTFTQNVKNVNEFAFTDGAANQRCLATFYYNSTANYYIMQATNYFDL